MIDGWGISCEIALRWMLLNLTDDKSALVPEMAWCRQAPSHYPCQCWPSSLLPYGLASPQWVNTGLNKMAAILQTRFWYVISWMKITVTWFIFHWIFVPRGLFQQFCVYLLYRLHCMVLWLLRFDIFFYCGLIQSGSWPSLITMLQ